MGETVVTAPALERRRHRRPPPEQSARRSNPSASTGIGTLRMVERRFSRSLCQESLDLPDGLTDAAEAQAPRCKWAAAVLAERWQHQEGTNDGIGHLRHLAAGF
jgi:hypothetical protein